MQLSLKLKMQKDAEKRKQKRKAVARNSSSTKGSTQIFQRIPTRPRIRTTSLSQRIAKLDIRKCDGCVMSAALTAVMGIVAIAWFSLEPLTVNEIQLGQSHSQNHRSIVNVYFTEACQLSLNSLTSKIIFAIIMSVYGILQLRLIQLLVFARKIGSNVMADIVFVKISSGISISVIFLGGIVIWLFYSANPSILFIAISTIDLVITAVNSLCLLKSSV